MLILWLLSIPVMLLNVLTSFIPVVTELPFGLDSTLSNGFGWFMFLTAIIPPLGLMYQAFLWVLGFKLSMKILLMIPFVGKMFGRY